MARLQRAEARSAALERRLQVYKCEAAEAQRALEQCAREAEALPPEGSLEAAGFSGPDLDAQAEAAALAEALLASEMALEATLAEHSRLAAELARATAPRPADNGRPEAVADERQLVEELFCLQREVAELGRRASDMVASGSPVARAAAGFGEAAEPCREDLRGAAELPRGGSSCAAPGGELAACPGLGAEAGSPSFLSAVGVLGLEVQRARSEVEAAGLQGRRAVEEADARCDALRQELSRKEAEHLERSRAAEEELRALRGHLNETSLERIQQATEFTAALTAATTAFRQGDRIASAPAGDLGGGLQF